MVAQETGPLPLTITLFGPMQVLIEGRSLSGLRSRKCLWLLALLALRHGKPVSREWLAGTLWPDADQEQAFASLRVNLSELRKALGGQADRVQSLDRRTLCLDLTNADVDVIAFDQAMTSRSLIALADGVARYRGPLLEGCAEEWAPQERRTREEDCLRALQSLADAAQTAGDHGSAAGYYRRAVALDPWSDTAQRGLMTTLAASGDVNAALQVYREFARLLRNDPMASPDAKTSELYVELRARAKLRQITPTAGIVEKAKPHAPAAPAVIGYLPHPLTEVVGLEDERLEVAAKLRRCRLITLVGPGGIGKTRLSIEVAAVAASEYPDGVWLVALESLTEGDQVTRQIATVLGVKEAQGLPLLESLTDHLRSKRLLLVLDNCEHLLEASAQAAGHLLRECAELKVLATSRESLGITGEVSWRVPSLATPDPAQLPSAHTTLVRTLQGYESVQLFVERAQAVQQSFSLTQSNALAVAHVCAHLDGIPLAIELAAARVRAMTVEQIADRFGDQLGLLSSTSSTVQTRQQGLRATLGWSYSLIRESERLLMSRLSVFVGGWTLEAAEAVCAEDGFEAWQVLDSLTSLADKSLVMFEERESEPEGRYRLLEMVRQFAAERLDAGGNTSRVRARHRDFFLFLAEEAEPHLKGPQQTHWLRRLENELGNLRKALAWCEVDAGSDAGLRMVVALWQFWELRGYYTEGRSFLSRAIGKDSSTGAGDLRAKALFASGVLAFYQGDYSAASDLYEQGLAIFRRTGNRQGMASSLKDLGRVAGAQGDYTAAGSLYAESLALFRELGDMQGSGWALNDLGWLTAAQGDYAGAMALHEESLAISRKLGDLEGIAWTSHHLGGVAAAKGDYETARTYQEESLAIFRDLGNKQGSGWALNYLAGAIGAQGDFAVASALYEEALSIFRELGNRQGIAWSLNDLGRLASAQGDDRTAQRYLRECITIQRDLRDRRGISAALRAIGGIASQPPERAVRLWAAAESARETIGARINRPEQERYERQAASGRERLGDTAYSIAWAAGCAMTLDEAADYAMED